MLRIFKDFCKILLLIFVMLGFSSVFSLMVVVNAKTAEIVKKSASAKSKLVIQTKPLVKGIEIKPDILKIDSDYILPKASTGLAPLISSISTKQPVVFLTIDDGAYKDASVVKMLDDNKIKASMFLAKSFISENTDFFKQITLNGSLVENHTINHYLDLSKRSYGTQKFEICSQADYLQMVYGRRPQLYRPPGGSYNQNTLRAANDCGMKAVVNWVATINNGSIQYQVGDKLRPGDIVLMHFRPEFKEDLKAFIDAKNAAGLRVELLENWLTPPTFE